MESEITNRLNDAVSNWFTLLNSGIQYAYFYKVYPPTCGFELTDEELYHRFLIWSFDNYPEWISSIPRWEAVSVISARLKEKLLSDFYDLLIDLTFVCIPASTPEENRMRYEEFSNDLCMDLGMINAYPYIAYKDASTNKQDGNVEDSLDRLLFDERFFYGKNILLFDDTLTTGMTIRNFANKLYSFGANIIAAITIGITCNERYKFPNQLAYWDITSMIEE